MDLAPPLGRPSIENFPSGLRKITRLRKLDPAAAKAGAIEASAFAPYGTADVEFTTALLIDQRIERRSEAGASATLVQVFQELGDNVLTATTEVVETTTFDGRRVTRRLYLCKASQYAFLRPIIGSGAPSVFQVEVEILGPVAKVTTFDIAITDLGFIYSQSDETKDNGKLLLRTIRTLAQIAATPAGYTLVGESTQETDGYTVYTANFAKGEGQISYNTSSRYNGMLQTVTIQYLTAASVSTQPTTDPLGGGILVDSGYNEQDGYRLWTAAWRKAVGTLLIRDDVEIRYGGKLVIYRRSRFNEAPGVPGGTIGGTVVETSRGTQLEDGFTIYNATWAEGNGRISLETETKNNGALVISTIRYFKTDDGGGVADGVLFSSGISKQDGIDLTTEAYAKGDGEISRDEETLQGELVTRTTIRHLVAPGGAVQPTSVTSGAVAATRISARFTESDGYRIWETVWASGEGLVLDETDIVQLDALVVYHRVSLGVIPEPPSTSLGGSMTLIESSLREADGYKIYDYRWAEGKGEASAESNAQSDGSALYTITTLSNAAETPDYPGGGTAFLVRLDQTRQRGHFRNTATYHKLPPAITLKKVKIFPMPGRASFNSNELVISPPSDRTILADEEVSYSEDQISDVPFKVDFGAYYRAHYIRTNGPGVGESQQQSLGYILADAGGISGTNSTYNGMLCDSWSASLNSSEPTARPTGLTVIDADNQLYLVALDGTKVYRRIKVTYTF